MEIFNGRAATEEYMSTHSLTFSTPEMTLKKFALWLGDQVNVPGKNKTVPRLLMYINDVNNQSNNSDFLPDTDESFKPSGAVTDMLRISHRDRGPNVTIVTILSKQHQNSVLNVDLNRNRIIIKTEFVS